MSLVFERVLNEGIALLSYVIGDTTSGTAAVIDPRPDVEVSQTNACHITMPRTRTCWSCLNQTNSCARYLR